MRNLAPDVPDPEVEEDLLTTGEAARLLNTSRQHVVNLCNRGDLAFVTTGTHRRVSRRDIEMLRSRTARMSRDQRRSLWLAYAIAGRIVENPEHALEVASLNLQQMAQSSRGSAKRWLDEWERLLNGSLENLLMDYSSPTPRGRELRQNSPFAGLLSDDERLQVLDAWKRSQ